MCLNWVWRLWITAYPQTVALFLVPIKNAQSAQCFPLNPIFLPLLWGRRLSHLEGPQQSVLPHNGSWCHPVSCQLCKPYIAVVPWSCFSVDRPILCINTWLRVFWHEDCWVPPSRVAPQRQQSDWGALCQDFWGSLLSWLSSSHWAPGLHLIPASAVTVSVTLSQLCHAPLGR